MTCGQLRVGKSWIYSDVIANIYMHISNTRHRLQLVNKSPKCAWRGWEPVRAPVSPLSPPAAQRFQHRGQRQPQPANCCCGSFSGSPLPAWSGDMKRRGVTLKFISAVKANGIWRPGVIRLIERPSASKTMRPGATVR